jgi:hypothetical protein
VVEWDNQGDIAAAFLADPGEEPDLTCAAGDGYQLEFVLP